MEAASFSSCLTREDFLIIQSFLPISDVVRLASLYNREWLSATRKTISDRTEVLGSLIEIHESELRGHQGIQLGEYIRLDNGKYRPIRELQELSPRHLKHLTELQFKPIHSSKYFPIPEGALYQFRSIRILCHTVGIPKPLPAIGLNFEDVEIDFCGLRNEQSEETICRILASPKLRCLTIGNSDYGETIVAALKSFILTASWKTVKMKTSNRAPEHMMDKEFVLKVIDKWKKTDKPTFQEFHSYGSYGEADHNEIARLCNNLKHPVTNNQIKYSRESHNWYFTMKLQFC